MAAADPRNWQIKAVVEKGFVDLDDPLLNPETTPAPEPIAGAPPNPDASHKDR